jgi:hypothetical protein
MNFLCFFFSKDFVWLVFLVVLLFVNVLGALNGYWFSFLGVLCCCLLLGFKLKEVGEDVCKKK